MLLGLGLGERLSLPPRTLVEHVVEQHVLLGVDAVHRGLQVIDRGVDLAELAAGQLVQIIQRERDRAVGPQGLNDPRRDGGVGVSSMNPPTSSSSVILAPSWSLLSWS